MMQNKNGVESQIYPRLTCPFKQVAPKFIHKYAPNFEDFRNSLNKLRVASPAFPIASFTVPMLYCLRLIYEYEYQV